MKTIENHCLGNLTVDNSYKIGANQNELFHIHPHYELLICTHPVRLRNILCGQQINTDYPIAILISKFIPHFTSKGPDEVWISPRSVLYFDDTVLSRLQLPFPVADLFGGGAVRVFNLSASFQTMRKYLCLLSLAWDSWEQLQLLSVILNRLYLCRGESTVLMNRTNDYIFEVIDYITAHLDEKLTVEALSARFFVSPDKLKKNFKQSTYTNIGHFVQEVRLNRAKELLEKRVPVNEVIRQCGYESSSNFFQTV